MASTTVNLQKYWGNKPFLMATEKAKQLQRTIDLGVITQVYDGGVRAVVNLFGAQDSKIECELISIGSTSALMAPAPGQYCLIFYPRTPVSLATKSIYASEGIYEVAKAMPVSLMGTSDVNVGVGDRWAQIGDLLVTDTTVQVGGWSVDLETGSVSIGINGLRVTADEEGLKIETAITPATDSEAEKIGKAVSITNDGAVSSLLQDEQGNVLSEYSQTAEGIVKFKTAGADNNATNTIDMNADGVTVTVADGGEAKTTVVIGKDGSASVTCSSVSLTAEDGVSISGAVTIDGDLEVTGAIKNGNFEASA